MNWKVLLGSGVVVAALITGIFSYLNSQTERTSKLEVALTPIAVVANMTRSAEATQTQVAAQFSPTPSATATRPPIATLTPTPLPTNTATPTPTLTPIPCPFQGKDDFTTLVTLINAEAVAVNDKNVGFIQLIFAPDAIIQDRASNQKWISPVARYPEDLFKNTSIRGAKHTDPMVAGRGITPTQAWLVSGSIGEWLDGNTWRTYDNPSKLKSDYGSDHWVFGKNSAGCWVIVQYDFNASHIPFPP